MFGFAKIFHKFVKKHHPHFQKLILSNSTHFFKFSTFLSPKIRRTANRLNCWSFQRLVDIGHSKSSRLSRDRDVLQTSKPRLDDIWGLKEWDLQNEPRRAITGIKLLLYMPSS